MLCDGPCGGAYHAHCMPNAPDNGEDQPWYCEACGSGTHECFLCKQVGKDNEDVFLCKAKKCGKFYHKECIESHPLSVIRRSNNNSFICPRHRCASCHGNSASRSARMLMCLRCTNTYHAKYCLPCESVFKFRDGNVILCNTDAETLNETTDRCDEDISQDDEEEDEEDEDGSDSDDDDEEELNGMGLTARDLARAYAPLPVQLPFNPFAVRRDEKEMEAALKELKMASEQAQPVDKAQAAPAEVASAAAAPSASASASASPALPTAAAESIGMDGLEPVASAPVLDQATGEMANGDAPHPATPTTAAMPQAMEIDGADNTPAQSSTENPSDVAVPVPVTTDVASPPTAASSPTSICSSTDSATTASSSSTSSGLASSASSSSPTSSGLSSSFSLLSLHFPSASWQPPHTITDFRLTKRIVREGMKYVPKERKKPIRPPYFKRVAANQYGSFVSRPGWKADVEACTCLEQKDHCQSADRCINRAMYVECNRKCPVGEACKNQRIGRRQYAKTAVMLTENRGFGLVAKEDLAADSLVIEYCGEIITEDEMTRRLNETMETGKTDYYFFKMADDLVIDAGPIGNNARFLNHSCSPNCKTELWQVGNQQRVAIVTQQPVQKGTELTYDYNFEGFWQPGAALKCYCGSAQCRGTLGGKKKSREEIEKEEAAQARKAAAKAKAKDKGKGKAKAKENVKKNASKSASNSSTSNKHNGKSSNKK